MFLPTQHKFSNHVFHRFHWAFCQLETLKHVTQSGVRVILEELPRTLDETYERMLNNINKRNRRLAHHLLQCIAVAVRPLQVEELAEILAFDFDDTGTGWGNIPTSTFHADWRPEDQEEAVLSICSSLIAIVDNQGSRVVQFSHLSVKEFLTSDRLAKSTGNVGRYHILPGPAHSILAQACLRILLRLDDRDDKKSVKDYPLAEYAARHWITHAQFEGVASRVDDDLEYLFDPDKPHFATWTRLYDIDAELGGKLPSEKPNPLYYSALCGLPGLVRRLAAKHWQYINAIGGSLEFPLFAAICRDHLQVARLLLEHGANPTVRDTRGHTALHQVIGRPDGVSLAELLLVFGADVNARRRHDFWTPLHLAANDEEFSVARMLLRHNADVNSLDGNGRAPLHLLSRRETSKSEDDGSDIARLLLEHGAKVDENDKDDATPLHLASYNQKLKIVRVLLEHGAHVNSRTGDGQAPLHLLSRWETSKGEDDGSDIAKQLLFFGANVNENDKDDATPLHLASYNQKLKLVRLLLEHGANADAENDRGETPLQLALTRRGRHDAQDGVDIAQLLLEHGAEAYGRDKYHISASDLACCFGNEKIRQVLLVDGGEFEQENNPDQTAFWVWIEGGYNYLKHSFRELHIFPRVQRGWKGPRQVRHNPVTLRIIPRKAGDGASAA